MKRMRIFFVIAAFALCGVIGYSGYKLGEIDKSTAQEADLHSQLIQYRPEMRQSDSAGFAYEPTAESTSETPGDCSFDTQLRKRNQSIEDLRSARPGAVGWLVVPNTRIDYPFAQGEDNSTFLHLDLDQRQSAAGTIFMDFRNSQDFSDFNNIIYGHNMKSGSMFASLQHFNNQAFFERNGIGTIFLAEKTFELEFIAFAVITSNDAIIFDPTITTAEGKAEFFNHVKNAARYYREVEVTAEDCIVTLSSCSYEFRNARMVLIGKLVEI